MKLIIYGVCDKGCVRDNNEDMILIGDYISRDEYLKCAVDLNEDSNNKYILAVADGMGGHNAGELASEIVLNKMSEKVKDSHVDLDFEKLKELLTNATKEIHEHILKEADRDVVKKGMGSTFIGVLFYKDIVYYMNVGDSRLYRFRRGNLMQISRDHSLREIPGVENINSNIIVNSFGGGEKIDVDIEPVGGRILEGDILLLCSDGLSDELTDDEIEQTIKENEDCASTNSPVFITDVEYDKTLEEYSLPDRLLKRAKDKGGNDNISFIVACITEVGT